MRKEGREGERGREGREREEGRRERGRGRVGREWEERLGRRVWSREWGGEDILASMVLRCMR